MVLLKEQISSVHMVIMLRCHLRQSYSLYYRGMVSTTIRQNFLYHATELTWQRPVSAEEPLKKPASRLSRNFIGDDGRVYACSGRNLFSFESNGTIAWTVPLNYTCNVNLAPVHGGSRKARF